MVINRIISALKAIWEDFLEFLYEEYDTNFSEEFEENYRWNFDVLVMEEDENTDQSDCREVTEILYNSLHYCSPMEVKKMIINKEENRFHVQMKDRKWYQVQVVHLEEKSGEEKMICRQM